MIETSLPVARLAKSRSRMAQHSSLTTSFFLHRCEKFKFNQGLRRANQWNRLFKQFLNQGVAKSVGNHGKACVHLSINSFVVAIEKRRSFF